MPDYIDVHAHVNFEAFAVDRDEVVKRALDNSTWMINVGTQVNTSKAAIELAEKYEKGVYAIVGLHPVHTDKSYHDKNELGEGGQEFTSRGEQFDLTIYRKMLAHPKVLGIGECGLDYFRLKIEDERLKEEQEKVFRKQIELAIEFGKPLMLHIRNAYKEAVSILKSFIFQLSTAPGNVHFFAGTWEEAKLFLDLGFTLSFTGVVTFARSYDEVIRNVPLDRILSETDCPYVTPVPHRGKRNEPLFVQEVVKKIAEIKEIEIEAVKKQIVKNATKLFSIVDK